MYACMPSCHQMKVILICIDRVEFISIGWIETDDCCLDLFVLNGTAKQQLFTWDSNVYGHRGESHCGKPTVVKLYFDTGA